MIVNGLYFYLAEMCDSDPDWTDNNVVNRALEPNYFDFSCVMAFFFISESVR